MFWSFGCVLSSRAMTLKHGTLGLALPFQEHVTSKTFFKCTKDRRTLLLEWQEDKHKTFGFMICSTVECIVETVRASWDGSSCEEGCAFEMCVSVTKHGVPCGTCASRSLGLEEIFLQWKLKHKVLQLFTDIVSS